jgi:hypothetical protein
MVLPVDPAVELKESRDGAPGAPGVPAACSGGGMKSRGWRPGIPTHLPAPGTSGLIGGPFSDAARPRLALGPRAVGFGGCALRAPARFLMPRPDARALPMKARRHPATDFNCPSRKPPDPCLPQTRTPGHPDPPPFPRPIAGQPAWRGCSGISVHSLIPWFLSWERRPHTGLCPAPGCTCSSST